MVGFAKFDPRVFLKREKQAVVNADLTKTRTEANRPTTLAGLATLAGRLPRKESQFGNRDAADYHHRSNKQSESATAKAAKAANVESPPWGDAQEERAAVIEYDGGAPRVWAEALARLDPARPPCDIPPQRWLRFVDDCGRFIDDGWADSAMALGWGPFDLFGCDRFRPYARIDRMGLLWLLNGQMLLALAADSAVVATTNGGSQTFRRWPNEPGRVLAWELAP